MFTDQLTEPHEDPDLSFQMPPSTTNAARLRTRTVTATNHDQPESSSKDASTRLSPQPSVGAASLPTPVQVIPTTTSKRGAKAGARKTNKASAANAGGARRSSLNSKKEKRERKTMVDQPPTSDLSSPALLPPNASSSKLDPERLDGSRPEGATDDAADESNASAITRCVCGEDSKFVQSVSFWRSRFIACVRKSATFSLPDGTYFFPLGSKLILEKTTKQTM